MGRNRAIGRKGQLPWHIPEDLAHFKALTWGHTIIMGRRTYDSLPHGALPGRRNVVISHTLTSLPNCEVCSLNDALRLFCEGECYVIGGSQVYQAFIRHASRIELTLIDASPRDADVFFPELNPHEWIETKKEKHQGFSFITLERISN